MKTNYNTIAVSSLSLIGLTMLSGVILSSSTVLAEDNTSVVDQINITVPVSCTMSGTGMQSHNAEIANGTYTPDIGSTTLHAFCNDNEGFSIYAAGYTGNEVGGTNSNKLVGTTASGNATIESGIATGPVGSNDVSNWAMKLTMTQDSGDTTSPNNFTIDSAPNVYYPSKENPAATSYPFSNYHVVPNEYVKVAHKNSSTDMTPSTGGVKLTTTYAAYISKTQPADTYSGQVIYTLVHPSNQRFPATPDTIDTGQNVNAKMKSLAAGTPKTYNDTDNLIKSIQTANSLPADFEPTEANTISLPTSDNPVYIFFDNTDDAGIMYVYSGNATPALNPDSSSMFQDLWSLSTAPAISSWDTSNVTNMNGMFAATGEIASTFSLDLSSWNTSNVVSMNGMFFGAGYQASTWSLNLSNWDTSSVTNMDYMFCDAGANISNTSTFSLNLSSWDTSNVASMNSMFSGAGNTASIFSLDLSSWDTSSVTDMDDMFYYAGENASTWSIVIPQTNGNNIVNTTSRMHGQTASIYAALDGGKAFTLAP